MPLARAVRAGSFPGLQRAIAAHEGWLLRKGLLLTLTYRLRALVWRSFTRRVFLLTYVPADDMDAGGAAAAIDQETDSRKAATLELEHLLVAARFVQRRLEGWHVPPSPHSHSHTKGRQASGSGINPMLLKAIINNNNNNKAAETGGDSTTTLVPPPGGPKILRPDEGLVWGNMPITAEHIESVVAGLVAQGLLNGFVAHAQARFAVIGARTKGAVAAGWPVVADVTVGHDRAENELVPGWVRDRDV